MRALATLVFVILLALIISPVDLFPGPPDDIIYGIIDLLLSYYIFKRRGDREISRDEPPAH